MTAGLVALQAEKALGCMQGPPFVCAQTYYVLVRQCLQQCLHECLCSLTIGLDQSGPAWLCINGGLLVLLAQGTVAQHPLTYSCCACSVSLCPPCMQRCEPRTSSPHQLWRKGLSCVLLVMEGLLKWGSQVLRSVAVTL